jgi:GDP/UDP-N,N'-diacetylbacillosamine 2-epimerase (hydrolysing)
VITMPNNDTFGSMFTEMFQSVKAANNQNIFLIESFGKHGYFHALNYSDLVFGNSSSGILEAASFGKYVVNVGSRQGGRITGSNIIDCDFNANSMIDALKDALSKGKYVGENIYFRQNSVSTVIKVLEKVP